jgi:eukaryotic-like serine/threonine-protein kinase
MVNTCWSPAVTKPTNAQATNAENLHATPEIDAGDFTSNGDATSDCDLAGDVAGHRILTLIARGGMGAVYRALDLALHRTVAVKVVQSKFQGNPVAAARFLEEARITAQLQHPGIPPVHQIGTLPDGRPFLAMKLIKGRTLAELMEGTDWDLGRVAGIFEPLCHAVAYAHEHGVVHRDLKPQNVMVGRFNEVQVMDWGLARIRTTRPTTSAETTTASSFHDPRMATGSDQFETRAGSVLGTPAYMPPEQAIGAIGQVTERSDVFSLGAILCTMFTGQPPYVGGNGELTRQMAAQAKLDGAYARLAACGADPELVALCRRCLSPEPNDRPVDAGEVAKAVATLRAAADDRARNSELDRMRAQVEALALRRRRRMQVAVAACMSLLLAGSGAAAWVLDRQATQRRAEAGQRLDRNANALAALVGRCETALRADDAETAGAAIAEIDRRLPDGGGNELAARIERCRRDLALTKELDQIDIFRWTSVDSKLPANLAVTDQWRETLSGYGVGSADETAAAALEEALIRDRLLTVLDTWLVLSPNPWLRDLLRRVDSDDFRNLVRDALVAGTSAKLIELAGHASVSTQPVRFTSALAQIDSWSVERRRELLQSGLVLHPENLTMLMVLGNTYPLKQLDMAGHRVRWFQAAVAAHPKNVVARTNLGSALYHQNDLAGAVAVDREAIRLNPKIAMTRNNLGVALRAQGNLSAAMAEFQESVHLDPKLAMARNNLGAALEAQGEVAGAVAEYREAIRLDPKYATPRNNLGTALFNQKDLAGAVVEYREAVRLDPIDARFRNNLGLTLKALGELAPAVAEYREAVRLDPKDPSFRSNLGAALTAQGDLAGAVVEYREAVRLEPNDARSRNRLGLALKAFGDVAGAVAEYREAIRLDPSYARVHNNLGVALHAQGDPAGAVVEYREAIRLDPRYAMAHDNLGLALNDQGDLSGAAAAYREAIRLDPNLAAAHHHFARTLTAQKNIGGAVTEYREVIRLNPNDATAHFDLGNALYDQKDLAGAAAAYRESVRLEPKDARARNNLGAALTALGDLTGAVAEYRQAIRIDPKNVRSRNNLGLALRSHGDRAGALAAFQEAVRLDPNYAGAHLNLGNALAEMGILSGAIAEHREAIRLDPKDDAAHNNLARLLSTGPDRVRDGPKAVEHATRACELTVWKDPDSIDTLAAAFAAAGDFDKAVQTELKALTFPEFEKRKGKAARERLELYRKKRPYYSPVPVLRENGPTPRVLGK